MSAEEMHDHDQAMFRLMRQMLVETFKSHEEAVAESVISFKLERVGF